MVRLIPILFLLASPGTLISVGKACPYLRLGTHLYEGRMLQGGMNGGGIMMDTTTTSSSSGQEHGNGMMGDDHTNGGHHDGSMMNGYSDNHDDYDEHGMSMMDDEKYHHMRGRIDNLFACHSQMMRNVTYNNHDGSILAQTESNNATVVTWLQEHVAHMMGQSLMHGTNRSAAAGNDPFFVTLMDRHYQGDLETQAKNLSNGVQVHLRAFSDCGEALIQQHTRIVDRFVEWGQKEADTTHYAVPEICLESDNNNNGMSDLLLMDTSEDPVSFHFLATRSLWLVPIILAFLLLT